MFLTVKGISPVPFTTNIPDRIMYCLAWYMNLSEVDTTLIIYHSPLFSDFTILLQSTNKFLLENKILFKAYYSDVISQNIENNISLTPLFLLLMLSVIRSN